jgi:hypothetical protein
VLRIRKDKFDLNYESRIKMKRLGLNCRRVTILFVFMSILFGALGQTSYAAVEPEFVATEIHQAGTQVYGLVWGDFDPNNVGMEVACLLQYGSVLQLSPSVPTWQTALRHNGQVNALHMKERPTISIGNVHSGYSGDEVVVCAGHAPSHVTVVFYDPAAGWSNEVLFDSTGLIGASWGARVGDYDPWHPGDEILHIYEGMMDVGFEELYSEVAGTWEKKGIYEYQGMTYVGMDSAAGDFNPDNPGPEIVVVTEMNTTYEIIPSEDTSNSSRRAIWGSHDAGFVVKIADVDPNHPGNEIIYGTRYNGILMSQHNGENPHDLEVLFTGNATEYGFTVMLDIAIGDILPQEAGLEILGVDYTGSVYLVRRVDGVWQGQVIWQDSDSLHAVIAGDFLPARSGDEILVAGESGSITLLSLTLTDNLTSDGKVNFQDFAELANYWKQSEPSADIGPWPIGDGIINILDLSVLADAWLQTAYWVE